jgi:lycopene beta-cyclase
VTRHQLVVVGDGPAGLALAHHTHQLGVDTVVVGRGAPWAATYGAWADGSLGAYEAALAVTAATVAVGACEHRLQPRYGVFDNEQLRSMLAAGLTIRTGHVAGVQHFTWGSRVLLADGGHLDGAVVVDASGSQPVLAEPSATREPPPMQTAYGLVLDERPQVAGDGVVLMDWRQPQAGAATFLYVVPLPDSTWLVEETSLATNTPPPFGELRSRLAARLGADLTANALHVEHVAIPMRPRIPSLDQPVVGFGAAAGYVHPATGYSVTASLRAASRVAAAVDGAIREPDPRRRARAIWHEVWPAEARRVRALHDFGLRALLDLGPHAGQFFDAFFDQPTERWMPYLRIDATVGEITAAMRAVFRAAPWPVRRRLALRNPSALTRIVR